MEIHLEKVNIFFMAKLIGIKVLYFQMYFILLKIKKKICLSREPRPQWPKVASELKRPCAATQDNNLNTEFANQLNLPFLKKT